MIQMETILNIMDNSGAKNVKCIKVPKTSKKKKGRLKHIMIGSVQNIKPGKKVIKGSVMPILISRTKKNYVRNDGSFLRFSDNSGIVLSEKRNSPIASRSFGPSPLELKKDKNLKQISAILNKVY